jgi:hypothetical protein
MDGKLLVGLLLLISVACQSQRKIEVVKRNDTFFVKHLYALSVFETMPPIYDNYEVVFIDTLLEKDSLLVRQIISENNNLNRCCCHFIQSDTVLKIIEAIKNKDHE